MTDSCEDIVAPTATPMEPATAIQMASQMAAATVPPPTVSQVAAAAATEE